MEKQFNSQFVPSYIILLSINHTLGCRLRQPCVLYFGGLWFIIMKSKTPMSRFSPCQYCLVNMIICIYLHKNILGSAWVIFYLHTLYLVEPLSSKWIISMTNPASTFFPSNQLLWTILVKIKIIRQQNLLLILPFYSVHLISFPEYKDKARTNMSVFITWV